MKVNLVDISNNPIEKIFKHYRICYSASSYDNVKVKSKKGMIDFIKPLIDEEHSSPLESVSATFSIEGISRACLSQLTRHRTFKFNVQSQRYIDGSNFDFVMPKLDYIKDEGKKWGLEDCIENMVNEIMETYEFLVKCGVKKEDARAILPNATTCNLVVTVDLNNFRNFLKQRLCKHAQAEIRELAKEMNKLIKDHVPFVDYKVLRCQKGLCNQCVDKSIK